MKKEKKEEQKEDIKTKEVNPKKPVIPSFTDAFENTDKPEYLITRKAVKSKRLLEH